MSPRVSVESCGTAGTGLVPSTKELDCANPPVETSKAPKTMARNRKCIDRSPPSTYLNTPSIRRNNPFFASFLGGSAAGAGAGADGSGGSWRAARRASVAGVAGESVCPPLTLRELSAGAAVGAAGADVSQPVTVVIPGRPPPCNGQAPTGSVPAMYTSVWWVGQEGVAGYPVAGSISIETMPSGARNGLASRYSR